MKPSCTCILALLLACAHLVDAQTTGGSSSARAKGENPDAAFVTQAAEAGIAEVELSALAARSAAAPDVRDLARRMLRDHERNNEDLAVIAAHENIALPKELDPGHARLLDRLSTLHGAQFDHAYVAAMLDDHEKMETLLENGDATVSTPELRKYVKTTLPAIRAHLAMTQRLQY